MRSAVLLIVLALLSIHAQWPGYARAQAPAKVIVTGSTVEIGIAGLIETAARSTSPRDMEALAVSITDRYHDLGYTTCFVEKILVRKDGSVEIMVRESRIAGLDIIGLSEPAATKLRDALAPADGEVYNSLRMRERAVTARRLLRLASLKISPENSPGGADVLLKVEAKVSPAGHVSGGMLYEPIYGITPVVHWEQAAGKTAVALACESGYRDGEIRKLRGDVRLFALVSPAWSLFTGYSFSKTRETWESRTREYRDLSHTPSAGARYMANDMSVELSLGKSFISLEGYNDGINQLRDPHIDLVVNYSDGRRIIDMNDTTGARLSMTTGKGMPVSEYYLRSEFIAHTTLSPLVWLKFRPRVLAYHTTMRERYYWAYVFDRYMPGFMNDFTAARSRYIAGLDIEFETYPETLYLGPVVNSGYFQDEAYIWRLKTGGGIAVRMRLGSFSFLAQYAWDLEGNPVDGGAVLSAEGTF